MAILILKSRCLAQAILEEYAKGDNVMLLSSITAQTGKQAPLNAADTTNEE